MGRSRARRTAAIAAASAVIHVLLLSALAIEATRPGQATTTEQTAIQVTLERPLKPPPETKPTPAKPRQTAPAAVTARITPPLATASAAQPLAPAPPQVDAGEAAAMGDLVRALRGSVGCAHPDAAGLSAAERAKCPRQFVAGGDGVKPLSGLTQEKRARFDQALHCYHDYYNAPVPPGPAPSNGAGGMPGLGYIPSMKECPRLAQ